MDLLKIRGNSIEGYLVRFTDEKTRDLDGEYFTEKTYFGEATRLPVFYHHGMAKGVAKLPIGYVDIEKRLDGIYAKGELSTASYKATWLEEQEAVANEYQEFVRKLGRKGLLGWSSGALPHTLEKSNGEIKTWILGEASLTPTPAMPENTADIKAGREFSSRNKERITSIRDRIKELSAELDDITSNFEDQSAIAIPPVITPKSYYQIIAHYLQENNGKH